MDILGTKTVVPIGSISPIRELASLKDYAPAWEKVDAKCSVCGEPIQAPRCIMLACACDPCRERRARIDMMDKVATYWRHLCPPAFLDTDPAHPGFPRAQFDMLKEWKGGESLLFYGPTGSGKTRLGMLLLYRCLLQNGTYVGCLWPEQLKQVKYVHDRLEMVHKWGNYEVLMMDDFLLTGAADERMSDFCKDLLDYRMRYKRTHIITSQIGSADYTQQSQRFGNATGADKARVEALLRRVKETSKTISFDNPKPSNGENPF